MQQVLVVHSLDRVYALPLTNLIEVSRALPTEAVAGAPPYVLGLAQARGKATVVVDLNRLLGADGPSLAGRYLSLKVDERRVILAVDSADEIRGLDEKCLDGLPPLLSPASGSFQGLALLDGRLLAVLDAVRMLSTAVPGD